MSVGINPNAFERDKNGWIKSDKHGNPILKKSSGYQTPLPPQPRNNHKSDCLNSTVTIPLDEYLKLIELSRQSCNINPCEGCQYYGKAMWVLPEAHPCNNCRNGHNMKVTCTYK